MIIKYIQSFISSAFLVAMVTLSSTILWGIGPEKDGPHKTHFPTGYQFARYVLNPGEELKYLSKEKKGLMGEYECCIKPIIRSAGLDEEKIKRDLDKEFNRLVTQYKQHVNTILSSTIERNIWPDIEKERRILKKNCVWLIQRLQRTFNQETQKREYDEQFPSLKDTCSMSRDDIHRLHTQQLLKSRQTVSPPRSDPEFSKFSKPRVAAIAGLSLSTAEKGCDFALLMQEAEQASRRHGHQYISYICDRILTDPLDHYFSFAIDDKVLSNSGIEEYNDEYGRFIMHRLPGRLDDIEGFFEIGIGIDTNQGMIFHRMFHKDPKSYFEHTAEAGGTLIH